MSRTVKVNLEIADEIPDQLRATAQSRAEEAVILALWEAGHISTRVAAEDLGLTYVDFLDLLAAKGIPVETRPINRDAIEEASRLRAWTPS